MKLRLAFALTFSVCLALIWSEVSAVLPPPRVSPLAGPQKAVADARQKVDQAKLLMLTLRKKVEVVFLVKPDFKAAKEAMDNAKTEYDVMGRKITTSLESSPDYKALIVKREKAQAVLDSSSKPVVVSDSGDDPKKITDEDIINAGNDHQAAVLGMKKMEKDAQDSDTNYAALKQKYNDTKAAWDALETQVDDAMKLDPDYPKLQQGVDQAEAALKQAQDQLAAAQKAAAANRPRPAPIRH